VKLLLDTHAFVWAVTADARLPDSWRAPITDASNVLLVSATTAWEMSIKATSGKWRPAAAMLDDLERAAEELGAELLPITVEHAIEAGRIEWEHRDPFDRMLAAQAIVEGAVLLTGDRSFGSSGARIYRSEPREG
jgi:PIN domain nuclease of toxin-antitoxin system